MVETADGGLFNSLRVLSCERSFQIWCKETGLGLPQLTIASQLELGAGTLAVQFYHKNHLAALFQPEGTPCYRDPDQVVGPSKPIPPFSLSRVYEAGVQLLHTKWLPSFLGGS